MDDKFSFCISTYKRPVYLKQQINLLLSQTYGHLEIVISDNDPEASARQVCTDSGSDKVKYYHNPENLGMMPSFNKSIERASNPYIVMVTDDDPIDVTFLENMAPLVKKNPGLSAYCAFKRSGKQDGEIEIIGSRDFAGEILDKTKTPHIFWSSCILRREDVLKMGGLPIYGSPHLADHALMAVAGSIKGGVIINKVYATHYLHDNNFSKSNFESYYVGCVGFYSFIRKSFSDWDNNPLLRQGVARHLKPWIISMSISLQIFFLLAGDLNKVHELRQITRKILALDFMKHVRLKYFMKEQILKIKFAIGIL